MASRLPYLAALVLWIAALWLGLDYAAKPKQPAQAVATTDVDWVTFFAANILPSLPVAQSSPRWPPSRNGSVTAAPAPSGMATPSAAAEIDKATGKPVVTTPSGLKYVCT